MRAIEALNIWCMNEKCPDIKAIFISRGNGVNATDGFIVVAVPRLTRHPTSFGITEQELWYGKLSLLIEVHGKPGGLGIEGLGPGPCRSI